MGVRTAALGGLTRRCFNEINALKKGAAAEAARDRTLFWYSLEGQALLRFEGEEWLYILIHSGHLSDGVGSAILAVDNTGNLYANQAHVCYGIRIATRQGREFRKLSDFLKESVNNNNQEKLVSSCGVRRNFFTPSRRQYSICR